MDSYNEFEQDLNRMPTDRRSSQNTTSPREPRTPAAASRRQANNQRHDESLYTVPQDGSGNQESDREAHGRRRDLVADRTDFLEEIMTQTRPGSRNDQFTPRRLREATTNTFNAAGGPSNFPESQSTARPSESFNASGRPFNMSEFATRPVAPQLQTPDRYNTSGRPFNLSEFAGTRSGSEARTREHRNATGRSENSTEFLTDPTVDQRQGLDSGSSRPFAQSRSRSVGRPHEPHDGSGGTQDKRCPLNSSKLPSLRPGSDQAHPGSLNTSNRRRNLSNLDGNRTASVQQPAVTQTTAFTSADGWTPGSHRVSRKVDSCKRANLGWTPGSHMVSRKVDSCNRTNLGYNLAPKIPLNRFDFCGESPSLMTANAQGVCSKDPALLHRSGMEFHKDAAARFDSGFGSRQQPSRMTHDAASPQVTFCHTGTQDCPVILEDKLLSLLQCGGIKRGSSVRHPLFNTLVRDTYYPGVIDDAVNGKVDFNAIAFDLTFGSKPIPEELDAEEVPMSLLQAFEERVNYEDDLRECFKRRRQGFSLDKVMASLQPQSSEEDPPEPTQDHAKCRRHRDELKLASTVDIDLVTSYRDQPPTALTTALACLAKAEKMNNFDKSVHMAEEAIRKRKGHTPPEKAALKSSCSFHMNMQKDEAKAEKTTYNPIEIISYVGTTKPREE